MVLVTEVIFNTCRNNASWATLFPQKYSSCLKYGTSTHRNKYLVLSWRSSELPLPPPKRIVQIRWPKRRLQTDRPGRTDTYLDFMCDDRYGIINNYCFTAFFISQTGIIAFLPPPGHSCTPKYFFRVARSLSRPRYGTFCCLIGRFFV